MWSGQKPEQGNSRQFQKASCSPSQVDKTPCLPGALFLALALAAHQALRWLVMETAFVPGGTGLNLEKLTVATYLGNQLDRRRHKVGGSADLAQKDPEKHQLRNLKNEWE